MISRKDDWALRGKDGKYHCDKVCLAVVSTFSFLSCDKTRSSLADETPGEGNNDS